MHNIARMALKGVTFHNPLKTSNGYTLFSLMGGSDPNVWLIDMEGHIVHRWRMPGNPTNHGVLLPNGNLLYALKFSGEGAKESSPKSVGPLFLMRRGDVIEELDWDGNLVRRITTPGQTHDLLPLPNGHVMYPAYGKPSGILPDKLAARWKGGIPGSEYKGKIFGDTICEVDQSCKIVWEWIAYKHLDPEIDVFCPLKPRTHFHTNSLWLCKDGCILVSMRHLSAVLKIEYPSGKVVARYGRGQVFQQHDAREFENGNIQVFDNDGHRPNDESD